MLVNAKQELIAHVKSANAVVKCALLHTESYRVENQEFILPVGYNEKAEVAFLNSLDFDYDSGYGGQTLFGTVWFEDGTWLERGEYDGSEWWEHKVCPPIPEECRIIEGELTPSLLN